MILYSYWRSTTSYRVRVALNLKGISYETRPVNLVAHEQNAPDYVKLNPIQGVPTMVTDAGDTLIQSLALLEYLDETQPEPPLLPSDPVLRARVRGAAQTIAMEIHPINNLKVLSYLKDRLDHSQDEAVDWMRHWMTEGFTAFEAQIDSGTPFSFGETPTMADICLAGQMINARRWGLDTSPFPRLVQIDTACRALAAFRDAEPENQPDATPL